MAPAIFSPLLPTTYPPNPISSKSQNREVSANTGKSVNIPANITTAKASISTGRHDRCNQLPRASSPTTRACISTLWHSFSNKAVSSYCFKRFFSAEERERRSTTLATVSKIPFMMITILSLDFWYFLSPVSGNTYIGGSRKRPAIGRTEKTIQMGLVKILLFQVNHRFSVAPACLYPF